MKRCHYKSRQISANETKDDCSLLETCSCAKELLDKLHLSSKERDDGDEVQSLLYYKQELQETMDDKGKSLDCIDYLIYDLEKNESI